MKQANFYSKYVFIAVVALVPLCYFLYLQHNENRSIEAYLTKYHVEALPVNRESAVRISQLIRSNFNIDKRNFKTLH